MNPRIQPRCLRCFAAKRRSTTQPCRPLLVWAILVRHQLDRCLAPVLLEHFTQIQSRHIWQGHIDYPEVGATRTSHPQGVTATGQQVIPPMIVDMKGWLVALILASLVAATLLSLFLAVFWVRRLQIHQVLRAAE